MISQNIKDLIKEVENYISVSVNGNVLIEVDYESTEGVSLSDDYRIFLSDNEFIQKYCPERLSDNFYDLSDEEQEEEIESLELRVENTYYIETKDDGSVYIDFGSLLNESGNYRDLDISEESTQAQIVHDYLTTKGNHWNTNDLKEFID